MKKQFFRIILMIAGVVTVAVILLSQSLYSPAQGAGKEKASKKTEQTSDTIVIQSPSDVVPTAQVQLDEVFPTILKSLVPEISTPPAFLGETQLFTPYLRILLEAIISPNAP